VLGLPVTPQNLAGRVSAEAVPDTVLIDVSVVDPSPQQAQRIAQTIDDVFPKMVTGLETAAAQPSPVVVTVVSQPDLPSKPTSPNLVLNVGAGSLASLLIGVVVVLAGARMDRSVKDAQRAEDLSGAPAVGIVLHDHALAIDHARKHSRGTVPRRRIAAEDFRRLRTNLQFVGVDEPPRTIMVASALRGEGTTTVAVNLALAMAESHRKVVLLEANLRQPSLSRRLGLKAGVGLSDILTDAAGIEDAMRTYRPGGFSVVTAGAFPKEAGLVLTSPGLPDLLVKLREENDVVLVDAPPLLPVADAVALAPLMDGVLLTVRYGKTDGDQLRQAATALRRVGARTLGVVVNGVPRSAGLAADRG
jgi:capsular exopolysaccharide synthesis family protein